MWKLEQTNRVDISPQIRYDNELWLTIEIDSAAPPSSRSQRAAEFHGVLILTYINKHKTMLALSRPIDSHRTGGGRASGSRGPVLGRLSRGGFASPGRLGGIGGAKTKIYDIRWRGYPWTRAHRSTSGTICRSPALTAAYLWSKSSDCRPARKILLCR